MLVNVTAQQNNKQGDSKEWNNGTVEATSQGLQTIPGSQSTFGWYEPHGFDDFCDSVTFAFDGASDSGSL